ETLFYSGENPSVFTTTLLALSAYFTVVALAVLVVTRTGIRGWAPFFAPREISIARARHVTLVLTAMATLLSVFLVARYGGIGALIAAAKVEKSLAGMYILRAIPAVGAVVAAATFLDARKRRAGGTAMISLLCAVANAGYVFLWGSRSLLVVIGAIVILGLQ